MHILVAGEDCKAVADAAAKLDGVDKVLLADAPAYAHMLAEPTAALIVSLAEPYETIVAPATTTGKNVMPRVAALLDVMQISDITKVVAPDTFERPIYAGNAIQTVRSTERKKVMTVRTAAFQATGEGGSAPVEDGRRRGRSRHLRFRRRGAVEIGAAGADLGQDHHFRRPGHAKPRELHQIYRAGGRQARRRGRRLARRGRCRLCAERLAGRADRQGGGARASISPSASPVLSSTSPA